MKELEVLQGDITEVVVDAIVNAANTTLLGGGGVDGAIHRAAGPELLAECMEIGGCPTGEARLTKGYRLSSPWIIHTVGPIWRDGNHGEARLLRGCYRSSLHIATRHNFVSLAFPAISCGIYGYPIAPAAGIAVSTVTEYLQYYQQTSIQRIVFVCFGQDVFESYISVLEGNRKILP
jgi:O-acetyl-ADP-ribose deacetylase